jgi:hypothetical protein
MWRPLGTIAAGHLTMTDLEQVKVWVGSCVMVMAGSSELKTKKREEKACGDNRVAYDFCENLQEQIRTTSNIFQRFSRAFYTYSRPVLIFFLL